MSTLNDKIVIVTGANSGMGMTIVAALADMGATVVMLCDLGDFASIKAFADAFRSKYKRLDILVNNAGFISLDRQYPL